MRALLALVLLLLSLTVARAQEFDDKGYGWLIDKLEVDGVPRERSLRVFSDPRVPPFDGLGFSLDPRESHAMYSGHLSPSSTARARRCMDDHLTAFRAAEQAHGVSASVVAAIVHVESACNRNTGNTIILPRLARLAMANEPANLGANIARHTESLGPESSAAMAQRVRARGQRLEDMFYPEVLGTFTIAARLGIDPLSIRGSGSGAFGMPQFLPTSYLRHGEDGNGDGVVSLYDPDDAIFSCAKYLAAHGWKPGITYEEQRRVIWDYNHSDAYIDAVLGLAGRIADPDEPVVETAAAPRPKRKKVVARRATSKKRVVAKKTPAKKAVTKKSTAKKSTAKTSTAKTTTVARKKATPKKTATAAR